jgi:hypothetical protein
LTDVELSALERFADARLAAKEAQEDQHASGQDQHRF